MIDNVNLAQANVLVTGGAGFIGRHLIEALFRVGACVTVLDQQPGDPRCRTIQADVLDRDALDEAMREQDVVWHLAAAPTIAAGLTQIEFEVQYGALATSRVLEAMRTHHVEQLLFSSSASVYGEQARVRMREYASPLMPMSLFAASKVASEALISAYCHLSAIRAWIFRFGNVIGADQPRGVIRDIVNRLHDNPAQLNMLGNGRQEKAYVLVDDCVDGMLYAFQHGRPALRSASVFNLAHASTTRLDRLVAIVLEEAGLAEIRVVYDGEPRGWPGDQTYSSLDVSRMANIGWCASHTSDEAIRLTARGMLA